MIERSPYNPKHIDGKPECIAHRDSLHGSALRPPESMQWRITDQDRSILDKLAAVSREDPDHAHLREIVTRINRLQPPSREEDAIARMFAGRWQLK